MDKQVPEDVPDSAEYLRPEEDPPEGYSVVFGPQEGRYAVKPGEGEEESPDESEDESRDSRDDETDDETDYVETEYGRVPDDPGPLRPEQRQNSIGSDGHPVLWERPDGEEEFQEYQEELVNTEWFGGGEEAFNESFFGDKNTENYHTDEDTGEYDEERLEKHDEWTDGLLNPDAETEEDEEPIGMILLGPPGAGKGYWQEQVEEDEYGETGEFVERDFTAISSDRTKEPIPEYTGENAAEVHDEASKMAKKNLAPKAFEAEHNVIVDKVATSPDSTIDLMEQMEKKGYDMRATFVGVPKEKAAFNAVSRYYDAGRFTPMSFIDEQAYNEDNSSASMDTFETIVEEFDIPDEKTGTFNNDVEWGEIPEPIDVGEELLKFYRQFFGWELSKNESNKTIEDVLGIGDNNNGKTRTGCQRGRDNGVDGGIVDRSSDRGNQGDDGRRLRRRVARRVTPPKDLRKEDTVGSEALISRVTIDAFNEEKSIEKVNVARVTQAPRDTIVSIDDEIGLHYTREIDKRYLSNRTETFEKVPDTTMEASEEVIELLSETYKNQVWIDDLSKASRTWEGNQDVDKTVRDYVGVVIEEFDPLYGDYKGVPHLAAQKVESEIRASLTQPQGWSTDSVSERINTQFGWMDKSQSDKIARMEVAAVLNKAKSVMLQAAEPVADTWEYDWVGPEDAETTKICSETKEEINQRGGQLTIDALKDLLREKSRKYRSQGGTPERVEEYVPHYQCRHTLERVD